MSSESILVIQAISLVFAVAALIGGFYCVKNKRGGQFVLWMILAGVLTLFLSERILAKTTGLEFPILEGSINSFAVLIQLLVALCAAVAIGLALINGRINGH